MKYSPLSLAFIFHCGIITILKQTTDEIYTMPKYTKKVTFSCYSKVLNREFVNVEYFTDTMDFELRAAALGWSIVEVVDI